MNDLSYKMIFVLPEPPLVILNHCLEFLVCRRSLTRCPWNLLNCLHYMFMDCALEKMWMRSVLVILTLACLFDMKIFAPVVTDLVM